MKWMLPGSPTPSRFHSRSCHRLTLILVCGCRSKNKEKNKRWGKKKEREARIVTLWRKKKTERQASQAQNCSFRRRNSINQDVQNGNLFSWLTAFPRRTPSSPLYCWEKNNLPHRQRLACTTGRFRCWKPATARLPLVSLQFASFHLFDVSRCQHNGRRQRHVY